MPLVDNDTNYYFNPWKPYGIIIASSHCPCQGQIVYSFIINSNGYNIVNADGQSEMMSAITIETNFEI